MLVRKTIGTVVLLCLSPLWADTSTCPGGINVTPIRCQKFVKYSKNSLTINNLKFKTPLELGGVVVKPEVLEHAAVATQVLDMLQFGTCQNINAAGCDHSLRAGLIIKRDDDLRCMSYLAIALSAQTTSDGALAVLREWLGDCGIRAQQGVEQKQPANKGLPLDTLAAQLRKAREEATRQDPLLARALKEGTHFDLNKYVK